MHFTAFLMTGFKIFDLSCQNANNPRLCSYVEAPGKALQLEGGDVSRHTVRLTYESALCIYKKKCKYFEAIKI